MRSQIRTPLEALRHLAKLRGILVVGAVAAACIPFLWIRASNAYLTMGAWYAPLALIVLLGETRLNRSVAVNGMRLKETATADQLDEILRFLDSYSPPTLERDDDLRRAAKLSLDKAIAAHRKLDEQSALMALRIVKAHSWTRGCERESVIALTRAIFQMLAVSPLGVKERKLLLEISKWPKSKWLSRELPRVAATAILNGQGLPKEILDA